MRTASTTERGCLNCGKRLVGRSDKRFCDIECRNQYHNSNRTEEEAVQQRVLKILRQNRNVLKTVLGEKTSLLTSLEKLVAKGFDDHYLTQSKVVGKHTYYYTFDYGYRVEDDGSVKVVKAFKWE